MADPQDMIRKFPVQSHHEVSETFADSMGFSVFDGSVLRMEFTASRMHEPEPPKPPTGERHVVARLVLTAPCAVDLFNQMQQFMNQLAATGLVTTGEGQPNPAAKPN